MTLEVDGPRPSVGWVASLPRSWTNESERLVLFALACDAFDDVSAPGLEELAEWTGMHRSSVIAVLSRLCSDDDRRPALVRRETQAGEPLVDGKRYGRQRTRFRLLQPSSNSPARPVSSKDDQASRLAEQQSGDTGQFEQSGEAGRFDPSTVAQQSPNRPATPVTPLPLALPSSTSPPRNSHLGARARSSGNARQDHINQMFDASMERARERDRLNAHICRNCSKPYEQCRQANSLVSPAARHDFVSRAEAS